MTHVPRILIVEDDLAITRFLSRGFRKELGAVSDSVDNAEAALRILGESIYDAVISDFNLGVGRLTGEAVYNLLKEQGRLSTLVFHTTDDRALALHAAVAIKPCPMHTIYALVRAAIVE